MSFTTLRTAVADGIMTLTLDRPARMNAFTEAMMHNLSGAFDHADADDAVRVVIVTGEGRAFCAGADLGAGGATFDRVAQGRDEDAAHVSNRDGGGRVTLRIFRSLKPVIAAVNGPAVGIGYTHGEHGGAVRVCICAARHCSGGGEQLVSAAHRWHEPGAGVVLNGARVRG